MATPSSAVRLHEPAAFQTILLATLIAGTLDITAAVINFSINGGKPINIFYFIASGVFGKEVAYGSGQWMAVVGLLFHYLIAFLFSLFLFLVYPWIKSFLRIKVLIGVLYGIFVWLVMNRIVLPLSNTPTIPFKIRGAIIGCLILIFCIGIPITFVVDRYYSNRKR